MEHPNPRRRGASAALVVLCCTFFVALAAPAGAGTLPEECDFESGYGCPSTTTLLPAEIPTPECNVSSETVIVGREVQVTITNVPDGLTITLTLGGTEVDQGTAGASAAGDGESAAGPVEAPRAKSARSAAAAPAGVGYSTVELSFVVPDLPPGDYELVATGPAFVCECLPTSGLKVLAAEVTRTPSSGGGSLARTGLAIGGFLLVAAGLVVTGTALRRRGQQLSSR